VDSLKSKVNGVYQIGSCVVRAPDGEFLVMRDIGEGPYPYQAQPKSCKRGEYQVASNLPFNLAVEMFKRPEPSIPLWFKQQYVAALLWRRLLGISDCNNRNIIFKGSAQRVYSVDEMVVSQVKQESSLFSQKPSRLVWGMVHKWLYGDAAPYVQALFRQWKSNGICSVRLGRMQTLWEARQFVA
jgi:hypothetical protein